MMEPVRSLEYSELQDAIETYWSEKTSSDPRGWTPDNPSWGQGAATSLVVSDYHHGDLVQMVALVRSTRERIFSHVAFRTEMTGRIIDLTMAQFPESVVFSEPFPGPKDHETTRAYILSHPEAKARYDLLKAKVDGFLTSD